VAYVVLTVNSQMNSRRIRILPVSVISFVLVYYSAAWAILHCDHHGEHSGIEASETHRNSTPHAHVSISGPAESVDCLDFDYHMEFLGGPTAPPELYRSLVSFGVNSHELLPVRNSADGWGPNPIPNVTRGSPAFSTIYAPPFIFCF